MQSQTLKSFINFSKFNDGKFKSIKQAWFFINHDNVYGINGDYRVRSHKEATDYVYTEEYFYYTSSIRFYVVFNPNGITKIVKVLKSGDEIIYENLDNKSNKETYVEPEILEADLIKEEKIKAKSIFDKEISRLSGQLLRMADRDDNYALLVKTNNQDLINKLTEEFYSNQGN